MDCVATPYSDGAASDAASYGAPMGQRAAGGHRDLEVWQRAVELTTCAYTLAGKLPATERFALANQIRRCAASVPANIAEGAGRLYPREFIRHISVARGSLMELDAHLEVAVRVGLIPAADRLPALVLIDRVGPMLTRLAKAVAPRE
jgi:four helix bundle protein